MRCGVVDKATKRVVNIIKASPSDRPPSGCWLVEISADIEHDIWRCEYVDGAFVPNASLQAEIDAELVALEAEGLDFS